MESGDYIAVIPHTHTHTDTHKPDRLLQLVCHVLTSPNNNVGRDFCHATAAASAACAVVRCLSVCLSLCRCLSRSCIVSKHILTNCSPSGLLFFAIVVHHSSFSAQNLMAVVRRGPVTRASNAAGVWNSRDFRLISRLLLESRQSRL